LVGMEDEDFVVNIIKEAKATEGVQDRKATCILTVSIALVGESTKFYHPQMVSIGPYHNHRFLRYAEKQRDNRKTLGHETVL
ncbi:hypothetical protein KI387_037125, partial [Taxus chinensis]